MKLASLTPLASLPLVTIAFVSALDACSSESSESGPSSSSGAASSSTSTSSSSGSNASSSSGSSGTSSSSGSSGTLDGGDSSVPDFVGPDGGISTKMNFFVTSRGNGKGGDFRAQAGDADGLAGADAFCKQLANDVSPILGAKTWRAYLSTSTVNARSRIGTGPFYNAKGAVIADSVARLHDEGGMNSLSLATNLDEVGNSVPSGGGNNRHDILTGTLANGNAATATCNNWTSSAQTTPKGMVGHSNRMGGGAAPTSWNAAHESAGCAASGAGSVESGGGRGSIYCFAP